jgi:hypothetical protein
MSRRPIGKKAMTPPQRQRQHRIKAEAMSTSYVVALYETDKAYGGPEEGGWWYDTGTLVRIIKVFKNEDKAWEYVNRATPSIDKVLNKDRYPVSSVLCTGWYSLEVHEDIAPQTYPTKTPRYK